MMTPIQDNLKKATLQAKKDPKLPCPTETQTPGKGVAFPMDNQPSAGESEQSTWFVSAYMA